MHYTHFLAMTILNLKRKQFSSNYFIVFFEYVHYKDRQGGRERRRERQKIILTKFPNRKVSPIRRQ